MKLSICTNVLADLPFTQMLDKVKEYGLDTIELTAGGWSPCPAHIPTKELLANDDALKAYKEELEKRNMQISALNCSGNPLAPTEMGERHESTAKETVKLAAKLGVETIVMMSGLPEGAPGDKTPNWITSTVSWPEYMVPTIEYQWEKTISWWKEFVKFANDQGISKIAIEEFPCQMVYNTDTFMRLRNAVGTTIGMNLDPSHLFAMGADPIAAARATGDAIYYIHGKDARIERGLCDLNGLMEYRPVEDTINRTWNYVAVGCGHDLQWWKEFFSVVRMTGYNSFVSLEMEDLTMSVDAGITTSIDALQQTISR